MTPEKKRLEELRRELRAERISYGELAELQDLREHIDPGDVELLEAAGVAEFPEPVRCNKCGWTGDRDDLVFCEDAEDGEPCCRACPKCETDHYLMDMEDEHGL